MGQKGLLIKVAGDVFVLYGPDVQAQAVALTVAQAFTLAFELWQVAKEGEAQTRITHITSAARLRGAQTSAAASHARHGFFCLSLSRRKREKNEVGFIGRSRQQFPLGEVGQLGEPQGDR